MFLMEEKIAPDGGSRIVIYMRPDGLFEARLYVKESHSNGNGEAAARWSEDFKICALAETLLRAQTIVYEELGLQL